MGIKQKYTFPGPYCPGCQYHQTVGETVGQTCYCNGFPKRRKSERFKRSDPKYKPPRWCPRRISPPVCRVYGFAVVPLVSFDRSQVKSAEPVPSAEGGGQG